MGERGRKGEREGGRERVTLGRRGARRPPPGGGPRPAASGGGRRGEGDLGRGHCAVIEVEVHVLDAVGYEHLFVVLFFV